MASLQPMIYQSVLATLIMAAPISPAAVLLSAAFLVPSQTPSMSSMSKNPAGACTYIQPGIVVERVAKYFEGEKAGLEAGDVILYWKRGNAEGEIHTPFDLSNVETEEAPRGRVTLQGKRADSERTWMMGPNEWRVTTRPNLQAPALALYQESENLTNGNKTMEVAKHWHEMANQIKKEDQCSSVRSWLLANAAEEFANARQWNQSDVFYEEALETLAKTGPSSEASSQLLVTWAGTFEKRGDLVTAEKHLLKAREKIEGTRTEKIAIARILRSLGRIESDRGEPARAEDFYQQSRVISQRLAPESLDVAASLRGLGVIAASRGQLDKAEDYYRQAMAIKERLAPGSILVADDLNNLGTVATERGELAKAEDYYQQSLTIKEQLAPNSLTVAATFNNLGLVAYYQGNLAEAGDYFQRDLSISERLAPGTLDIAISLNNLGMVASDRGNLAKAEDYYRQSLAIKEKQAPNSLGVADDLGNLGNVSYLRGDATAAESYMRQALVIKKRLASGSLAVADSLFNLGELLLDGSRLTEAEKYLREALSIREKLAPDSMDVADNLNDLGELAYKNGDISGAESYFQQALAIMTRIAPESLHTAECLNNLGSVRQFRNDLSGAESDFRHALAIQEKAASGSMAYARTLSLLARCLTRQQQTEEAARLYGKAIDVFRQQLEQLGGSGEVRADFRAQHRELYADYADLLIAQKKLEQAFEVMESSRARTLLETLAQAHVDIRQGADPGLIDRERLLQATLNAKTNRKVSLLEGEHTEAQVFAINNEIGKVLTQYRDLEGQIRASSPKYAALTQPQPLSTSQVQQQLLDIDTVLLEYTLGSERSYVFLVTPTSLAFYELPKRAEVEKTARQVYDALTARNRKVEGETSAQRKTRLANDEAKYESAANRLSEMVLWPLAKQIEKKRLLIVADGALQYIPFGVLPVPRTDRSQLTEPLVAEHEIVNLPSASVLALLRQQAKERVTPPTKEVAILADPVFEKSDPRVIEARTRKLRNPELAVERIPIKSPEMSVDGQLTRSFQDIDGTRQAGAGLSRLVFSRREAGAIMSLTKSGQGMEALDFKASRATAMSKELSQYRIVHFATHGLLDNEHPELSGLVLSMVRTDGQPQNGFLDLEDIYNLTLPSDLVVLSACETGLGKEISGEGLVGLTRGFMYAGASRVVASLWKVDDLATSELMGEFYKAMLQQGMRPAAALRQAQTSMSKQKRWSNPYYWAAFTIQGDWQ